MGKKVTRKKRQGYCLVPRPNTKNNNFIVNKNGYEELPKTTIAENLQELKKIEYTKRNYFCSWAIVVRPKIRNKAFSISNSLSEKSEKFMLY